MKLEQSFEVTAVASEIETRIAAYMQRNGYQPNPASKMTYSRGSRIGSFFSFSPRKWRTTAHIAQQQQGQASWHITLSFDINDEGQLVTQHERLYWKAELDDFQRALQTGEINQDELAQQARQVVGGGVKGLVMFLFTGLFVALVVSFTIALISPQNSRWAILAGAFSGVIAGLIAAKRHWGF